MSTKQMLGAAVTASLVSLAPLGLVGCGDKPAAKTAADTKPAATSAKNKDENSAAWSDAAKAMSRKLRPTDSIYRLAADLFALVLPETDTLNAKRVAVRLQEELQEVRAKHGRAFDITVHNYPEHAQSSHELEDIVKSLLPEQDEWNAPTSATAPAAAAVPVHAGTKK